MAEFRIAHGSIDQEPTVAVSAPDGSTQVVVALRGATLLRWQASRSGEPVELTDGYRSQAELLAQDGVRNGVLAPFPNRVAGGRYRFSGQKHDLQPGQQDPREAIYHGFARSTLFELAAAATTAHGARLEFRSTVIRPGVHPGYPFSIDLEVLYLIAPNKIYVEIRATNTGEIPAPYAAGWHPYFTLGRSIDDLNLQIPARTLIRTDSALIPLKATDAFVALEDQPTVDFRRPRRLGAAVIDACFGDLQPGPTGRIETVLCDPATGSEIRVWQRSGFMHVFTGDTLERDRRRSIALEPVEVMTNAFNRDECTEAILLEPGQQRHFQFGAGYRN